MTSCTPEDHKKYLYALNTRDLRRIYARIRRTGLEPDAELEIACLLEQAELRLLGLAFFRSPCERTPGETVEIRCGIYSDGRPVTTSIEWGESYATVVQPPDPRDERTHPDPHELAEEFWDGEALERAQSMRDDTGEDWDPDELDAP